MKCVGFFGGTFDPIHWGHLNLALELLEIHGLDEVLFCPARRSPLKGELLPAASGEDRLAMVRLAVEGVPRCRVIALEVEREGISYTVDTVRLLYGAFSEPVQLRLLLSEETALRITEWKEWEELLRLAPPLIGVRDRPTINAPVLEGKIDSSLDDFPSKAIPAAEKSSRSEPFFFSGTGTFIIGRSLRGGGVGGLCEGVTRTRAMEISSTEVRERLKEGRYCGHLVPERVLHYIGERGLYL